jgi:hypothetical protein
MNIHISINVIKEMYTTYIPTYTEIFIIQISRPMHNRHTQTLSPTHAHTRSIMFTDACIRAQTYSYITRSLSECEL